MRRIRGFTLIELIVVVLILGLLATVAVVGYTQVAARAQVTRVQADLRQLSAALLAEHTLAGYGDFTREEVLAVLEDASGASVAPALSAAGWQLGGPDDVATGPHQFALAFDQGDGDVVEESGARAALVTAAETGKLFAIVLTTGGVTTPSLAVPAGTTPAIVLGAIPAGSTVPVFSEEGTSVPPPPPTPTPTPAALTLAYPSTTFDTRTTRPVVAPTLSNAIGPVTYAVTGALPAGVTFDPASGQFTGPAAWPTRVLMVSAGGLHSAAIDADGSLWTWGSNIHGQLGDGTTTARLSPTQVPFPGNRKVTATAAGRFVTFAIADDGTLWGWGSASASQIPGYPSTGLGPSSPVKIDLPGSRNARAVAADGVNVQVVATDGTLWGWGANSLGSLGDGSSTARTTPVQIAIPGGRTVSSVEVRPATHVIATDGTLWGWGANSNGQLGDGTTTRRTSPVQVVLPGGRTCASVTGGSAHTAAVAADGTAWTWGYNANGRLGDGTFTGNRLTPHQVTLPAGRVVTQIQAGEANTFALAADGTLWGWGSGAQGALGVGLLTDQAAPRQVTFQDGPSRVSAVSSGTILTAPYVAQTVAIGSDGSAWAWGPNAAGQLGDGTALNRSRPVRVNQFDGLTGYPAEVTVTATDSTSRVASAQVTLTTG